MLAQELKIGIVGAGLMGHGIAQVFASAGAAVSVHDPLPDALASVRERVASNLASLGQDESVAETLLLCGSLEEAVSEADWVFEAAPERLELKQELFERLERAAPRDCVLATNTSVMRVTEIATRVQTAERALGTHRWNPPYLVPLVEVVQGERTDPEFVARTLALLEDLGKTPVHVRRDVAGFVGNRLQHALWRQAFELVDSGVCEPEDIDTVVKASFGRRLAVLGPIENADLIGLDLTLDIHEYVLPTLDPPSEPSAGLRERVGAGQLGMKTGVGYRAWSAEEADEVRRGLLAHLAAATPLSQGGERR
jgi:3-hydroxybutyryl-CoA dehydrogenase